MTTRLKVILAAMGVAALASPAMAQAVRHTTVPLSENNVFWGMEDAPLHGNAYGSNVHPRTDRPPHGVAGIQPRILDCVHVPFPQCGGS